MLTKFPITVASVLFGLVLFCRFVFLIWQGASIPYLEYVRLLSVSVLMPRDSSSLLTGRTA